MANESIWKTHVRPTAFARWFWLAVLLSVGLHYLLWQWSEQQSVEFSSDIPLPEPPVTFTLEAVQIDANPEQATELAQEPQPAQAPEAIRPPDEKISLEQILSDVRASPSAPDVLTSIFDEKPSLTGSNLQSLLPTSSAPSVQSEMEKLEERLLQEKPDAGAVGPVTDALPSQLQGASLAPEGPAQGNRVPGFSNLDDLLAQTGPLRAETAPILMPTDLLFDYDSYDLRPEALDSLRKLGTLIRRNPDARFIIEGHTDSFGGDAYNRELSQLRAERVKAWLMENMNVNPVRVATQGFGSARLIAPGSGSIEEQQINRRVEIVIQAAEGETEPGRP